MEVPTRDIYTSGLLLRKKHFGQSKVLSGAHDLDKRNYKELLISFQHSYAILSRPQKYIKEKYC